MAGKDLGYHPEDDPKMSKMSIAPPPSAEEFLINKTNEEVFIYLFIYFILFFISRVWKCVCVGFVGFS